MRWPSIEPPCGYLFCAAYRLPWKALPAVFGISSSVHRYFQFWGEHGVSQSRWKAGPAKYDEAIGIDLTWLSADGCIPKSAPGAGVLLALAVTGANRHDVSLLEAIVGSILIERLAIFERSQHLCLDRGYAGEPVLGIVVVRG
jgi:transposase